MKQLIIILIFSICSSGFAQQLTYTPKNPAFGGDPFNYTWMLNSANAQNPFSEDQFDVEQFGDFANFDNTFGNQFTNQFGTQTPEIGTSRNGNLEYEVYESTQGLVINILDITTGEYTQIIIPNG
ncbi:MAG: curli assembly protein CsgF [Bacteroidia bacterium]|nr:curli assembly protein CsgF [Bacteroidia bacterium]NNF30337.1 curli assembly protein CsgF [Flavobacteriaceae bacterium]MBT8276413.1 curli assembly protein CsgF [Bacteroidia bacterium]NNJ80929.1 curli assembly protein CsgF [Flavobacteriaceae bacterium]NNK53518.1 curli assembly protein CsgF [Flavobacteriaceae bacterium]